METLLKLCSHPASALVFGLLGAWLGVRGLSRTLTRSLKDLALDLESLEERFSRREKRDAGVASARARNVHMQEAAEIAASANGRAQPFKLPGRANG